MKAKQFDKIVEHYAKFFGSEKEPRIFGEIVVTHNLQVDLALFAPSEKFQYQALCSIGASEYKMPLSNTVKSPYNEYLMFLDKDFDLKDDENVWAINFLRYVAKFPFIQKTGLSNYHTIQLFDKEQEEELYNLHGNNMSFAYIMRPEAARKPALYKETFGSMFTKKTICFYQVMPITRAEYTENQQNGQNYLYFKFYHEKGCDKKELFLTRSKR
ncbi:MAG: suppressor of fused domain protein [Clostridiales bacterium]|nr:suppressor of fused domain protein [Clostridiales bacterium]